MQKKKKKIETDVKLMIAFLEALWKLYCMYFMTLLLLLVLTLPFILTGLKIFSRFVLESSFVKTRMFWEISFQSRQ